MASKRKREEKHTEGGKEKKAALASSSTASADVHPNFGRFIGKAVIVTGMLCLLFLELVWIWANC